LAAVAIAAFCAGAALVLGAGLVHERQPLRQGETWREFAWPFPRDAWPPGRAFRCHSSLCGDGTEVYLRMKSGLCSNCETGVTEDAEVDRVSDLDLISERFAALAAGEPIRLGDMSGRIRRYKLQMADGTIRTAMGLAFSRQCDLVIAVVLRPSAPTLATQSGVEWQLPSADLARWVTPSSLSQAQ
jgi:hypothetical protein